MKKGSLCFVVLLLACGLLGCRRLVIRSEIHLLPEGYEGPVVIVFGDPDGQALKRDSTGAYVFQIPASGYSRFRDDRPTPTASETHFYFVQSDNSRKEVRRDGDPDSFQIFGEVVGGSGTVNGQKMIPTGTHEYIVGVPSARGDWVQLRMKLTASVAALRPAPNERK